MYTPQKWKPEKWKFSDRIIISKNACVANTLREVFAEMLRLGLYLAGIVVIYKAFGDFTDLVTSLNFFQKINKNLITKKLDTSFWRDPL